MKPRVMMRIVLLLLLLVGILVVGTIVFRVVKPSRPQVLILPGGARFELLGMSKSGEEFSTEQPWLKRLRPLLPGKMGAQLPMAFTSKVSYGNTNALSLWFTLTDATGANISTYPWQWYLAVDDKGFAHGMNGGSGSSAQGGKTYHHLDIESFPRRQKDFELRFLDGAQKQVASIRVSNPFNGPFPTWKTESLPVTHTNGGVAVTLESLTERTNQYGHWVQKKVRMTATDPHWKKAKSRYEEWFDATGNRGGQLSFDEPTWKLRLTYHREGWTNFLDEEKFRLADLPVPAPGEMLLLQTNFTRGGIGFTIHALAGSGTLTITNGTNYGMSLIQVGGWSTSSDSNGQRESIGSAQPFFLIDTTAADPLDEVTFRVVGPDGKNLNGRSDGWYGRPANGRRYFQKFDGTNGIATILLEVTVSRGRRFEFLVNPTEVIRAGTTNK